MNDYRKIYEREFGIKWDRQVYEVHHIDGNHQNNKVSNLILIPKWLHTELHKQLLDPSITSCITEPLKEVIRLVQDSVVVGHGFYANGLRGLLDICTKMSVWGMFKTQRYVNGLTGEPLIIEGIWKDR